MPSLDSLPLRHVEPLAKGVPHNNGGGGGECPMDSPRHRKKQPNIS